MRIFAISLAAALVAATPVAFAQHLPATMDGLNQVHSTRVSAVYLAPGADFRGYTKVMLDPTEVSFKRNWQRDYNLTAVGGARINNEEAANIASQARTGFEQIFTDAYRQAGFEVVTQPGPDVLRLRTGVIDLYLAAPDDDMRSARSLTYSVEAGEATLVIEARDSQTGALLGRVFDRRTAGGTGGLRTSVSNRSDFGQLFRHWAQISVDGLNTLKTRAPASAAR